MTRKTFWGIMVMTVIMAVALDKVMGGSGHLLMSS